MDDVRFTVQSLTSTHGIAPKGPAPSAQSSGHEDAARAAGLTGVANDTNAQLRLRNARKTYPEVSSDNFGLWRTSFTLISGKCPLDELIPDEAVRFLSRATESMYFDEFIFLVREETHEYRLLGVIITPTRKESHYLEIAAWYPESSEPTTIEALRTKAKAEEARARKEEQAAHQLAAAKVQQAARKRRIAGLLLSLPLAGLLYGLSTYVHWWALVPVVIALALIGLLTLKGEEARSWRGFTSGLIALNVTAAALWGTAILKYDVSTASFTVCEDNSLTDEVMACGNKTIYHLLSPQNGDGWSVNRGDVFQKCLLAGHRITVRAQGQWPFPKKILWGVDKDKGIDPNAC